MYKSKDILKAVLETQKELFVLEEGCLKNLIKNLHVIACDIESQPDVIERALIEITRAREHLSTIKLSITNGESILKIKESHESNEAQGTDYGQF